MLSGPRATYNRIATSLSMAVKAGAMIHQGGIVVAEGGFATSGRAALALTAMGMATETIDNTTGADGDQKVQVEKGCFLYANSAADPVGVASLNQSVFIEDDETVSATDDGGARSPAGVCFDVDDTGVWVRFT